MKKEFKIKFDLATKAFEKLQEDLLAAEMELSKAEDDKSKSKAESKIAKLKEKEAGVTKNLSDAQEAYFNAPDDVDNGKLTGSVDSEYEFNTKDKDHYHVKHSRMEKLPSGALIEDPGSIRIQMYDKNTFEDQKLNQEKGLPSIWDMGETVTILHDPTK